MIVFLDIVLGLAALLAWSIMLYNPYFKRFWDIVLSALAIIVFSPLMMMLTILGSIKMKGNPFFTQPRPGKKGKDGKEKIFRLIKFRSMTCEKDKDGDLLPDEKRLTNYGKKLRSTSLDELPELFNILKGDMSIIGPRPQLVRDMVFMSETQRCRHDVRPGLTGLAQVMGRNSITWEDKINWDLNYIGKITLLEDSRIFLMTIKKVFGSGGNSEETDVTDDYGDALLKEGKVSKEKYAELQEEARYLLGER